MANQSTQNVQSNHDPSSPYYIHPSDASSTQLVSNKFDGIGFSNWKRSMMLTLSAKNKIGFVDGSIKKPVSIALDYKAWERCNNLVISWILFNLDGTIAKSVLFLQTAEEIWNDLEERSGFAFMTQVYALEQQLSDISQGSSTVSEFYTQIKTVWDSMNDANPLPHCTCNLCTCNLSQKIQQRQQEQRLIQFMMKLSDKFSAVRGHALMMHHLPNVPQACRLFVQEENHKEIGQGNSHDSMAFMADRRSSYMGNSYRNNNLAKFRPSQNFGNVKDNSGSFGNNKGNTGNSGNFGTGPFGNKKVSKPGANYYCTHCQVPGHSIDRCFQIHGFPPGFKGNRDKRIAALVYHQM